MTTRKYNVVISIYDVDRTRNLHFCNVSIQMFYALRKKYFSLYGERVEEIAVYFAKSKKRVDALCWHRDSEIDLRQDLWERDGI